MADKYKKLYEAQCAEHEKTHKRMRRAEKEAQMQEWNYQGAMADLDETVAVMRKHLLAMTTFLDLNYPKK